MKAVARMTSKYYERQAPEIIRSADHDGSSHGKFLTKGRHGFKYYEVEYSRLFFVLGQNSMQNGMLKCSCLNKLNDMCNLVP